MANHKSAKKRIRSNERKRVVNKSRLSRIRTFVKKVEAFVSAGKKKEAEGALKSAEAELAKGAGKGVLHRNTAARKTSRLYKSVKAMK